MLNAGVTVLLEIAVATGLDRFVVIQLCLPWKEATVDFVFCCVQDVEPVTGTTGTHLVPCYFTTCDPDGILSSDSVYLRDDGMRMIAKLIDRKATIWQQKNNPEEK